MSVFDDLAEIWKNIALQNAEAFQRRQASLTPEQRAAETEAELAFLRQWDAMDGEQKSAHVRRLIGERP